MKESSLLDRFRNSFIKAVTMEMESMKKRLGSFELGVTLQSRENGEYRFSLAAPTDKLTPGMQCSLRTNERGEFAVEIREIQGTGGILTGRMTLPLESNSTARLIIYPWFLYEKLMDGLKNLSEISDATGLDLAYKAFGTKARLSVREKIVSRDELNESQREAIEYSLGSDVSFIWGPPGTGKTHTLARLLEEFLQKKMKTLVVSTTNGAVDTVIDKLRSLDSIPSAAARGEIVRLGRPHQEWPDVNVDILLNRINEDLLSLMKVEKSGENEKANLLLQLKEWGDLLEEENDQMDLFCNDPVSPVSQRRQEELFRELAPLLPVEWEKQTVRAKQGELQRLAEKLRQERDEHRAVLENLKSRLIGDPGEAVSRARLVFSTLASLYTGRSIEKERFDVIIIEEAGMAVLPALFFSITRAGKKAILVGDPMQLPPVVQSGENYVKRAMGRSIYQVGLEENFSDNAVHLLDTQYRMHPNIGTLVSSQFYRGLLKNGIEAQDRREIADFPPSPGKALCLVDLEGRSRCERKSGSYSRINEESARACLEILENLPGEITAAVITPYADQARLTGGMISRSSEIRAEAECHTVHRFQGQERDVVIIDLVDGAPMKPGQLVTGEFGANLLNVAVSRAKGKLIVVAEASYFREKAASSCVSRLIDAIRSPEHNGSIPFHDH